MAPHVQDCLARWESEHRKLKRFLELRKPLNLLCKSKESNLADVIAEWPVKPSDPFTPSFWKRLKEYWPVIKMLHVMTKETQSG